MTTEERIDYWKNCSYPRVGIVTFGIYKGLKVEFTGYREGVSLNTVGDARIGNKVNSWAIEYFDPLEIKVKLKQPIRPLIVS